MCNVEFCLFLFCFFVKLGCCFLVFCLVYFFCWVYSYMIKSVSLSMLCIFSTAVWMSSSFFAPVQTSLPLANSKMTTLGFSMRYIRPGNCSGSYMVCSIV